jgi:hypothetical protein
MPNYISNFLSDELSSIAKLDEKQDIGIAGFNTLAIARQSYVKSSTVPIIPLENGSFAADHVIENPLVIEIEGTVNDIYYQKSPLEKAYIRALAEIGNIDRYLPDYTRQQILAVNSVITDASNVIRKVDDYINSGEQLYNLFFSNSAAKTIPEKFIDLVDALMDTNQAIKIELPYRVFDNMIITGFQVIAPQEYASALEFRLTAVQIRYTQTLFVDISKYYKNPSSAVSSQTTGEVEKGINKTQDVPISALSSLAMAFGG